MILYVCSLLRYLLAACFLFGEKRAYSAVCVHVSSIVDCLMKVVLMTKTSLER